MPRIRALKPETPSDEKLASVVRDARLTFLYCLTIADDDGLFRANPRQLLGQLYPHDDDVTAEILEEWLAELTRIGVLRWRETKDGARVGEVVNWEKHQQVQKRAKPFLANQLIALPVNPPGSLREVPEHPTGRSPEVLKSRSPEVLKSKGPSAAESKLVDSLDPAGIAAWECIARAARNAEGLAAEIVANVEGMRGRPVPTWEAVSLALQDMSANGAEPNARLVRGYIAGAMRTLEKSPTHAGVEVVEGSDGVSRIL